MPIVIVNGGHPEATVRLSPDAGAGWFALYRVERRWLRTIEDRVCLLRDLGLEPVDVDVCTQTYWYAHRPFAALIRFEIEARRNARRWFIVDLLDRRLGLIWRGDPGYVFSWRRHFKPFRVLGRLRG